jgi:hypothetical protein
MTFYKDLGTVTMIAAGDRIRAVGWLNALHPYQRGKIDLKFVERLRLFCGGAFKTKKTLRWFSFCGRHECEFCGAASGSQNCGLPWQGLFYVFPELIVHYVEVHSYLPPQEFIAATMQAPLPGTPEYNADVCAIFPELRAQGRTTKNWNVFRSLGPECGPENCRGPECARKRVKWSSMCRLHHFEMVTQELCPFTDDDYTESS